MVFVFTYDDVHDDDDDDEYILTVCIKYGEEDGSVLFSRARSRRSVLIIRNLSLYPNAGRE